MRWIILVALLASTSAQAQMPYGRRDRQGPYGVPMPRMRPAEIPVPAPAPPPMQLENILTPVAPLPPPPPVCTTGPFGNIVCY
jgi:hypothetical protein